MSYLIEEYLQDAIAIISDFDFDDEAIPGAIYSQARLMAALEFEETLYEPERSFDTFQ